MSDCLFPGHWLPVDIVERWIRDDGRLVGGMMAILIERYEEEESSNSYGQL